ncbi:DNA gyrase subunit A [Candidatus Tachikawaea gelatinosa]|uniref:DNA gyrase subunit A n=1 Tax=Candidatus Tachikawaea gelatinosa TaxID=1410383 RepID=A0A090BWM5_9ENTR|nr:DNA gyrase subunit A [Candidatus Tachikawaea gelatinosa]
MTTFEQKIKLISIEDELKNSYLDYAMSVIIGRALPDVRDGLKPVHRRILYAMRELGNDWNKSYKKSARIVGDVIGKYHPHGDSAVYESIVRMAQSFSLRYPLIDGQGNFGSVDGDPPAAMRYTEIRMKKIASEFLCDLEKDTVNFIENYDNTEQLPEVLPTKIPSLLVNGSSGIAVGMATNIPPHNLKEVINGCLAYIKNKNISIEELMNFISGPDFPTAGIINGNQGIKDAYRTGRGKIYIRARSRLEINHKTARNTIIVYELPYQVNKARLIEKIAELVKEKRLEGVHSLRDESDKDGMRMIIELKRDSIGEIVLNNLYSMTQLQTSFGINMVALHQGKPKTMNLKEIIIAFIDHRKEIVLRRTIFELNRSRDRVHILEGLLIAILNVDKIISIIRLSIGTKEAKETLINYSWSFKNLGENINAFGENKLLFDIFKNNFSSANKNEYYYLSEKQAQSILELKLQKLTGLEHQKIFKEYNTIVENIYALEKILDNKNILMEVIYQELKDIKNRFGDKRLTEIHNATLNLNIEDLILQKDVIVTLSHKGYVKYQPLNDYAAQHRGGKGKSAAKTKEEDFIDRLLVTKTHDTILCFSNRGRLYSMKVHQLPEANRYSRGRPIVNLLPLEKNERITAILPINEYKEEINIFMASAKGTVKKTAISELIRSRNAGIIAVNLREDDELIGVAFTKGTNTILLFSSTGKVVCFNESSVRTMKRTASGVRGIKLAKDDYVVSLIVSNEKIPGTILTVTKKGYGKRTEINKYPIKSRGTRGVISIKVTQRSGPVISAIQVFENDQIMIITDTGKLVRIRVSEVSTLGRNTQGVILIRTLKEESVVGLQRVVVESEIF